MSAVLRHLAFHLGEVITTKFCVLAVAAALLVKFLAALIRRLRLQWVLEKDFPVPPGAHWLLGHLMLYTKKEREYDKKVMEWVDKYPDSYVFKHSGIWPWSRLCIHHPGYIKEALHRSGRKEEVVYRVLRPWIGDGLLTTSGAKWFRNRRLLTPGFHFEVLRPYVKLFSDSTNAMLENWGELPPGSCIDVFPQVSLMTLDSMLKCALSQDTGCQSDRMTFSGYISAVHQLSELAVGRFLGVNALMGDFIYNLTSAGKRYKKACARVHQFSETIIRQRKEALHSMSTGEITQRKKYLDFLDILLMAKDEDGNGLTDAEIRDEVDTFMFAGHDTAASGLSWTLYCLARSPEHQEKCRKEAQEVLQERTDVTWQDLSSMKYITMCVKESLRLYPPVSMILRKLENPLTFVDGKTVPEGTTVTIYVRHLHQNPTIWEKPEEYDPLRFSPERSKGRHPYAFLPFSAGPRNCIGQHFAMNELKTAVALILQRFSLTLDDTLSEPFPTFKIVLRADPGIFLKVKPIKAD